MFFLASDHYFNQDFYIVYLYIVYILYSFVQFVHKPCDKWTQVKTLHSMYLS